MSFREIVRHVRDGEPVDAAVTGRPTRDLEANLRDLRQVVEEGALGSALFAADEPIDPALPIGAAVAWDPAAGRYAGALALAAAADPASGLPVVPAGAEVVGVVARKYPGGRADIALLGRLPLDLAGAVVDGAPTPGRYYLSASVPGGLVRARPAQAIPVLYALPGGAVLVNPAPRNALDDHGHARFELEPRLLSGTDGAGWLPADHAQFAGRAPAGAAFGYHLAGQPTLAAAWPPSAPEAACLFVDRGSGGGQLVPDGPEGLVQFDRDGIWWMSDCPGVRPFPEGSEASLGDGPASLGLCPPELPMRLILSFVAAPAAGGRISVRTLQAEPGGRLRVTACDGTPARSDDLLVALEPLAVSFGNGGHIVVKQVTESEVLRGPVVEGLLQGDGVVLSSPDTTNTDEGLAYQGLVRVDLAIDGYERELVPDVIRLGDVEERFHAATGTPYLALPAGRASSLFLRFHVPTSGIPAGPQLRLRLWLAGSTTGTLPTLTARYARLPRPAEGALEPLPTTTTAMGLVTNLASTAGSYREVLSTGVAVAAGSTYVVTIARANADGYAGEVGLLKASGLLGTAP